MLATDEAGRAASCMLLHFEIGEYDDDAQGYSIEASTRKFLYTAALHRGLRTRCFSRNGERSTRAGYALLLDFEMGMQKNVQEYSRHALVELIFKISFIAPPLRCYRTHHW
mmetsp:Transcript_20113/g.36693  ORF Transcript_20113/g.36693 Transcript_20113/m.36693 type:complete len:111 (+) Transcript_20113:96-428(+)